MTFLLDKRMKYVLGALFVVYFMQGFFYTRGSLLSKSVLFVFLFLSGIYALLTLAERPRPIIFWWIWALIGVHVLGSLWSLTQGYIYFEDDNINVFMYDKNVFLSWIPFFIAFYFSRHNMINQSDMIFFLLICLAISIFAYYGNLMKVLDEFNMVEGDITNNIGYYFVSLFPFLVFFRKKPILMYVLMGVMLFFIISAAKRGAILIGGFVIGFLFLQQLLSSANRQRFLTNLFLLLAGIVVLSAIAYTVFEESDYLQRRLMHTLKGDSSGRDTIYSSLFYAWVHADSIWNYLFGLGFLSSIKIAGNYAHNDWLEMLTSFGLVGVVILVGLQYAIVKGIWNPDIPSAARWCIGMIFSIIFFKMIFSMCVASGFDTVTLMILLGYILGRSAPKSKIIQLIYDKKIE